MEIFPNELPDFLILDTLYEAGMQEFSRLRDSDEGPGLIGKSFKTRLNQTIKIVDIKAKEVNLHPNSPWEVIHCKKVDEIRGRERNGRRG